MLLIEIDVLDGQGLIEVAVVDLVRAERLREHMKSARLAFENEKSKTNQRRFISPKPIRNYSLEPNSKEPTRI